MRKISVFLLIISIFMVLSLTSCKHENNNDNSSAGTENGAETNTQETTEPKNATELFEVIDKNMSALDSYETKVETLIKYNYYGMHINVFVDGSLVVDSLKKDNPFFYQYSHTTMKCEEQSLEQEQDEMWAYDDGKMYIYNKGIDVNQKLYSNMTKEDFEIYLDKKLDDDFDFTDCKNADATKMDDGGWTLEFSGYTKKTIDDFCKKNDFDATEFGFDIIDFKVTVKADKDLYATSIRVDCIFDSDEHSDNVPECVVINSYSNFNNVKRNDLMFEKDGYTEVEDVRIFDDLEEKIEELYELNNCKFTLDVKQEYSVDGSIMAEYAEKDTVVYGNENGGFYYNIAADVDGDTVTFAYKNGMKRIEINDNSQNYSSNDAEERTFINGLINSVKYDPKRVTNIQETSDGVYKLDIAYADPTFYQSVFEQLGIDESYGKQTIIFTIENDKIVKMESEIQAIGQLTVQGSTSEVQIIISCENVFSHEVDAEQKV